MVTPSSNRLLCVPCGSNQCKKNERISALRQSLEKGAQAQKPKRSHNMGTNCEDSFGLVAYPAHPSSLDRCTLHRQTPKMGAQCVNCARWDLCGGCSVRGIPTAIQGNRHRGCLQEAPAGDFGIDGEIYPLVSLSGSTSQQITPSNKSICLIIRSYPS